MVPGQIVASSSRGAWPTTKALAWASSLSADRPSVLLDDLAGTDKPENRATNLTANYPEPTHPRSEPGPHVGAVHPVTVDKIHLC